MNQGKRGQGQKVCNCTLHGRHGCPGSGEDLRPDERKAEDRQRAAAGARPGRKDIFWLKNVESTNTPPIPNTKAFAVL